jgi:hypothetical protein
VQPVECPDDQAGFSSCRKDGFNADDLALEDSSGRVRRLSGFNAETIAQRGQKHPRADNDDDGGVHTQRVAVHHDGTYARLRQFHAGHGHAQTVALGKSR